MGRLSAALLVDSDPKALETLAYAFEGDGCRVTRAEQVAQAAGMAASSQPQVAVVALRNGADLDGLGQLKQQAPHVVVLGPVSLRAQAKALGLELMPLPIFVRDVVTAGKILASMSMSTTTPGAAGDVDVHGSLSDYGLFYLVRAIIALGRSAILQVERSSRRGEIRFADGEVTAAQVGSLQGPAALHHLLLWEEAVLELKLRASVRKGTMNKRPDDLVEEAERFLRDFAAATKDLGPTRTVFLADQDKASRAGDSIPVEVVPVVRLIDGQRSLGDVIEDSPFRVFDTVRIMTRLMELGILTRKEAPEMKPTPIDKGPLIEGSPEMPPAAPVPKDQRNGPGSRRKPGRRPTLEHGVLASPAAEPSSNQSGELRATASAVPSIVVDAPSFVVDMAATEPVPAPAPLTMGSLGNGVSTSAPARSVGESSIEIDPGLMSDAHAAPPTPAPVLVAAPPPAVVKTPPPVAGKQASLRRSRPPGLITPAPVTDPTRQAPGRRASAEFDAVEADFFAREAELFKEEAHDDFKDLDHGGNKALPPRRKP